MKKNYRGTLKAPRDDWEYLVIFFSADPLEQVMQRVGEQSVLGKPSTEPAKRPGDKVEITESRTVDQGVIEYLEQNSLVYPNSSLGHAAVTVLILNNLVMRVYEVKETDDGFQTGKELYRWQPKQHRARGFRVN